MHAETDVVDSIIHKYGTKKEALIPILQDIQSDLNWLPEDVLKAVAEKLQVPLISEAASQITGSLKQFKPEDLPAGVFPGNF